MLSRSEIKTHESIAQIFVQTSTPSSEAIVCLPTMKELKTGPNLGTTKVIKSLIVCVANLLPDYSKNNHQYKYSE